MKKTLLKLSLFMLFPILLLCGCNPEPKEIILFDFESESELDLLEWHCHAMNSISSEHYSHGSKSLKLSLYPSDYPGLDIVPRDNNWRKYRALCFDVYNCQEDKVSLSVRIDDMEGAPAFKERYNESFVLKSGINHIRIPIVSIVKSGDGLPLNLGKIARLIFFVAHPQKRVDLYFDYLRVIRDDFR